MRYLGEKEDISRPVRSALGTASDDPGCFEARKCSAAGRQERCCELEMGIWSAIARNMDTPESPRAAMHCHAEIAARECRDWAGRNAYLCAGRWIYYWNKRTHESMSRRCLNLCLQVGSCPVPSRHG